MLHNAKNLFEELSHNNYTGENKYLYDLISQTINELTIEFEKEFNLSRSSISEYIDYAFILKNILTRLDNHDKTMVLYQNLTENDKVLLKEFDNYSFKSFNFPINPKYFCQTIEEIEEEIEEEDEETEDENEENEEENSIYSDDTNYENPFDVRGKVCYLDFKNKKIINRVTQYLEVNNIYLRTKDLIKDAIVNKKALPYSQISQEKNIDKEMFKHNPNFDHIRKAFIKNRLNESKINYIVNVLVNGNENEHYFENDYLFNQTLLGDYKFPDDKFLRFINNIRNIDIRLFKLIMKLKEVIKMELRVIHQNISSKMSFLSLESKNEIIDNPKFDWDGNYNDQEINNLINERRKKNKAEIQEFNKVGLIGPVNE